MDLEDFESVDAFNLDWEMSACKQFQELLDKKTEGEIDSDQDLGDTITTTLLDLFNTRSTLVLKRLISSAWVRGEADIEVKISYFELLSHPWEDAPSLSDRKGKRKKQQVSEQQQTLK